MTDTLLNLNKWIKTYPEAKLINWSSIPDLGSVGIYSFRLGYFIVVDDQYVVGNFENYKKALVKIETIWEEKKERYNDKNSLQRYARRVCDFRQ